MRIVVGALAVLTTAAPVAAQMPRTGETPPTSAGVATPQTPAAVLARARRLMEAGEPGQAEPLLRQALAGADAAGDHAVASLAEVALGRAAAMTSGASAAEWFARAEARAREHGLERTLGFLDSLRGNAAYERGDVAQAEAFYLRAIPHFEQAGAFDELANTLRALAVLEPPAQGLATLRRALDHARQARSTLLEGQVLFGLSDQLFVLGRWADALDHVQRALPLLEQAAVPLDQARARIGLGRLHRMHGDRAAAQDQYAAAERLLDPVARGIGLSTAWSNLSAGWRYVGDMPRAMAAATRASDLARRAGNGRDITFATLAAVEVLLAARRDAEVAAVVAAAPMVGPAARTLAIRRAFALSRLGRHTEAVAAAAGAERVERGWMEAQPGDLAILAEIHRTAGHTTTALAFARQAVEVLESLRGNAAAADMLRVGFDDGYQWVHGRLVRLLAEMSAHAEAMAAAEHARARAFGDLLMRRGLAVPSEGMPSVDALVAVARDAGCPVVAYWTDDDGVLVWVVTPAGQVTSRAVAVAPARLAALVARTWSADEPRPRPGRRTAYQVLYDLLVAPVRDAWPSTPGARVAIVPHGPLFRLSFAGLMDARGRYVVEQVSPFYAPSFAVLSTLAGRAATASAGAPLVVAVSETPLKPAGIALAALPGAAAEGQAVARRFAGDAEVLAGASATELAVRARLASASVLHFAAHALVDDAQPMDSFLALAGAGGADADGRLTADEVYRSSFTARLAVLSGCRTASGRVTGDGVVGLSRAFFSAGVPTLVASLWDLPDVAGRAILPAFYDGWQRDADAARALRAAQLGFLRALRAGRVTERTVAGPVAVAEHPAIWANLVVMGAP